MNRFVKRCATGIGLGVALFGLSARAMFMMDLTENVPIERVITNLERTATLNPTDIETRLNLGRIHAMAYARKSETWPVVKPSGRGARAGEPSFGPLPGLQLIQLVPAKNGVELELARAHLPKAIAAYDAVLAIDPKHTLARIGRAWCQDQAGDKVSALAGYRALFDEAWKFESAGALPPVQNFMPTTIEVGGYLLPLLDPVKDAAEIATIGARTAEIQRAMRTRPITPIVIPLRDAAPLASLATGASCGCHGHIK